AEKVAGDFGLSFIDKDTLAAWQADGSRTLFLLDVRSQDEFRAGHLPGSRHAPGGQQVQGTDRWVGVRGARVVVCDDTEVRAVCTAHWLKQMGWNVHVLKGGIGDAGLETGETAASTDAPPSISAADLAARRDTATVLDLRPSNAYLEGHIPGALWAIRPTLGNLDVDLTGDIVLVADDVPTAALVAADLAAGGAASVALLDGGMAAWDGEVATAQPDPDVHIDYVAFTAERHGGNKDHMRQYLEWEIGLVGRLDDQERGVFSILHPAG
ncbi:MAG: rhodanese-like domain-containing protein, partial [Rhodospirillaceae bacterium]